MEGNTSKKYYVIAGIPAYNEEKYIAKVILKTRKYVDEVIVVNDGSTDMTPDIARALGATVIDHGRNLGYGEALRTIFREARKRDPDALVILDADGQHNPDELPKLIKPVLDNEADIVIGSRFLGRTNQPKWRVFGVKFITWLLRNSKRSRVELTDAQSGFRAYSRKAIACIEPEDSGMGASVDIIYQAVQNNLRIREVPISIEYHKESSTQNPILHGSRVVLRIVEVVAERHPLACVGIPGVVLTITGVEALVYTLLIYSNTGGLRVDLLAFSLLTIFFGAILTTTSVILHVIARLKKVVGR